jgi:hypothetical protein
MDSVFFLLELETEYLNTAYIKCTFYMSATQAGKVKDEGRS